MDFDLEKSWTDYKRRERVLKIECPTPKKIIPTTRAKIDNTYHTANELPQYIKNLNSKKEEKDNYSNYSNYSSQEQFEACQKKRDDLFSEYKDVLAEYPKYLKLKKQQQSTVKELKKMGFEE